MNKIKFDLTSNLIMLDIYLWNRNTEKYQNMLITFDTGASNTVISKDILHFLGYDFNNKEKVRITTASGIEYVDLVVIDKIKIGGHTLKNVEVYAHNFPESSFSLGVVGLNIMKNFDIEILFSTKELILNKLASNTSESY